MSSIRRLQLMCESKQKEWEVAHSRLAALRQANLIETDPSIRFKFTCQITTVKEELLSIEKQINEIEENLISQEKIKNSSDNEGVESAKKIPETVGITEPPNKKLNMKEVNVFISFAQEDIKMLEQLEGHLTPLESINIWHQNKIIAGSDRINVIQNQLNIAKLILLLISSKFLNSADCQRDQAISLERYKKGKAIVIPILLKDMHLEGSSIENLEWLPKNRKPISSFSNKDKAFAEVVKGVSITIQSIQDEN